MIVFLFPAYNEAESMDQLIPTLCDFMTSKGQTDFQVILCDDGSTDGTGDRAREQAGRYPVTVISHSINRGLGETSRDLFEYAAAHTQPGDVIVRMDADNSHKPDVTLRLIEALEAGADVAIASRFQTGGGQMGVGPRRALISRAANLFMKVVFPIKGVSDYSCGYRAYRAEIIQKAIATYGNAFIQLKGLGFTCTLEKLIKLDLLGARFVEVGFMHRYDLKKSSSKMITSVTTLGYLVMALLHHWPFGGWRSQYRHLLDDERR